MTIATQFPDYNLTTLPPIPADWIDVSHGNDVCPAFTTPDDRWIIWVDYADPAAREFDDCRRYTVRPLDDEGCVTRDDDATLHTDDWGIVLAYVSG